MDEPTVGVDPQSRNYIFEFIKRINKENKTTVIYTSHYMEEVENLCNSIFIIDLGKEIASGSKSIIKAMSSENGTIKLKIDDYNEEFIVKIKELKGVKDCFREEDNIKILVRELVFKIEDLLNLVSKEGKKIKYLNIEEASLEEVFLALTGKKLRD
ncbi:Daunorubicin/doxorubicin resistance ATP-binding protein DrrA [compost metagenome]